MALPLVAVIAALAAGCGGPPDAYPGANLLLVTLDTTRADRIGAYGYAAADTPRLDALAEAGVLFEQAVSPVPLTLPSHATLMTARIPPRHGLRDNGAFEIADGTAFLARELEAAGYDTAAFVAAFVLHSRWGLAPGFAHYDDRFEYGRMDSLPGQVERRGDRVVDAALPWLRQEREAPFFAWVHLYDPHAPYEAPEPWSERFDEPYDAEIAFTDHQVGRLLDALEEMEIAEETLVVVVGDHGEALGDHGEPGHGLFVYDATQIVPLILRLPGGHRAGERVRQQAPMEDIAPTLLELLGTPVPEEFEGESLLPLLEGEGEDRPAYSETLFPRFHFGWQELYALRADGYKYIQAPREELYDLEADPGEGRNIVLQEPGLARRMREQLDELRGDDEITGPDPLGGDAAERLRALGYIGSAPADVGDGPLPDPKDKLPLLQDLTRGQSLVQARRPEPAVEILRDVIERDDRIVDAHVSLGNALFQLERYEEAAAAFRAAVELNPDYEAAISNLALSHLRLGDTERARADFEALLVLDPSNPSAHYHLGEMALS
ncbi:MAG: sulfatase-like hydrolase/transferase, partial [Acidobacteriota bacterium]